MHGHYNLRWGFVGFVLILFATGAVVWYMRPEGAALTWMSKWVQNFPGWIEQGDEEVDIEKLAEIIQFCMDTGAL